MKHHTASIKSKKRSKDTTITVTLLDKMDMYFQKNEKICFWIIFGVTALVSMLLYDPRVSLGGDDSEYILAANRFLQDFHFPGAQAMLYKIALSPVAYFFGLSLFPLKMFSMLSILGFMYFTFRVFRGKIPASILMPVLALVSINSYVLYYASQTYSEAFFMFMLSLFFLVFFRFIKNENNEHSGLSKEIKILLCLALSALSVALTRLVGFSIAIGIVGYFLFYGQWRKIAVFLACYVAVFAVYSLLKDFAWGNNELQFSGQGNILLNKDPYKAEEGRETIAGFIVRFWQNSNQYISNGLFRITGFKLNIGENNTLRMLLVYFGAVAGLCFSFKRNRYLFATIIVAGAFLSVSFIVLQVFWNQERLIIPAYPFILMSIFACIYYFLLKKRSLQFIYPAVIGILLITGLNSTVKAISEARKLTNRYSGLTPDWTNYLKASEWAGKNLNSDELVACRKHSISTIYGNGKRFHGIYSVNGGNIDAFMHRWTAAPDSYVAVSINDQTKKHLDFLRKHYYARLNIGEQSLWVLNRSENLDSTLYRTKIQPLTLPKVQELNAKNNNNFGVFYADSLLNQLKQVGVTHILTANLRLNPKQKNDRTVNTVERYLYYIMEKYPNIILQEVHKEGADENEPAQILKINWSVFDK